MVWEATAHFLWATFWAAQCYAWCRLQVSDVKGSRYKRPWDKHWAKDQSKAYVVQIRSVCCRTRQKEIRPMTAKFFIPWLEVPDNAHFSHYIVKYVSGTKTLPISYVFTVFKKFSKCPGEGAGILRLHSKSDLKCIGRSTYLPCTKWCELRETAELNMLYGAQPDSAPGWTVEDYFFSLRLHLKPFQICFSF